MRSERAAQRVFESVCGVIERRLKLKVNREKSSIRHAADATLLGFGLSLHGPHVRIRVDPKAVKRLKDQLKNPRLKEVHWQAAGRPAPGPQVATAGESAQFVDPAEIPADADVARLGRALAQGRRGDLHELMANTAAYAGLRQGELFALTAGQVAAGARVITVDCKVVEVAGKLYLEAPKGRKRRSTIYPACTPDGYPLADTIAARAEEARAEQAAANPLGLMFPSPRGVYWRSSNFDRRVLAPAYLAAGWRGAGGAGAWTWHSLRHVFCTTALFTWRLEPTDVSCMAGHANVRVTLDMYVGATAGVLDRARTATQ